MLKTTKWPEAEGGLQPSGKCAGPIAHAAQDLPHLEGGLFLGFAHREAIAFRSCGDSGASEEQETLWGIELMLVFRTIGT